MFNRTVQMNIEAEKNDGTNLPVTIQYQETDGEYLEKTVFELLLPAMEKTLIEAHKQKALPIQKCRFNGIDYLAEVLWNLNPRRCRSLPWLNVFDIPPFKAHLKLFPRPIYPKSWLWSDDDAARRIQRYVRGWLVRKQEDVQEMRRFWKEIAKENKF